MLPKKYHAIAFIGILVMLLLLGLHLLGIGFSSSQAAGAKSAALARNSTTQLPSSSNHNSQVYRHPIVYDKLTGATNNQINDVLGTGQPKQLGAADYPIDHYQQQQIQHQLNNPFNPHQLPPQDDGIFFGHHRPPGFPPHPMGGHPMHNGMGRPGGPAAQGMMGMPPPPPPVPPQHMMQTTTQSPPPMNMNPLQPVAPFDQQRAASGLAPNHQQDSVPSASSLNDNGARAVPANQSASLVVDPNQNPNNFLQQQQPGQPIYYTPPIFAYNNNNPTDIYSPQGQPQFAPQPQLGPPEAPMSIDEYQARQARLSAQQQRQVPLMQQADRYGAPKQQQQVAPSQRLGASLQDFSQPQQQQQPVNLLADPQAQARHKQQMLDRQLLFGNPYQADAPTYNQTAFYPDPALYRAQQQQQQMPTQGQHPNHNLLRAPPYAHTMVPSQQQPDVDQFNNNNNNNLRQPAQSRVMPPSQSAKLLAPSGANTQRNLPQPATSGPQASSNSPSSLAPSASSQLPLCARQAMELVANSSNQSPVLFCNEDSEYPNREIMRALELYANERSIEQLLPQSLVQLHLSQRPAVSQTGNELATGGSLAKSGLLTDLARGQLILDPLQPNINLPPLQSASSPSAGTSAMVADSPTSSNQQMQQIIPSGQYEPMCRSLVFLAQPRRARNLMGQWKVIINLPGHKYRGIAISQMVRVEECSRPHSECASPSAPSGSSVVLASVAARTQQAGQPAASQLLAKSRCLQQYENQRLVAWSHQQGLHVDVFRVPIACSCHIRR